MRPIKIRWAALVLVVGASALLGTSKANAQESRADLIAGQQEAKSRELRAEEPDKIEQIITKMQKNGWVLSANPRGLYPYFDSVYSGGGFTLGAGYRGYYGNYSFAEIRGLYSLKNYKKFEFRTVSKNYAGGHLDLNLLGGWMDATQIPYYGLGIDSSKYSETNFRIQETYARGGITVKPVPWFHLYASSGYVKYMEKEGTGMSPSIAAVFNPTTAPGLGASPSYIHTETSAAIMWAPAEGYARRGGVYRFSLHDYRNVSGNLDNFLLTRAEAVQHIPILRETWVLSLRGRLDSVAGSDALVPYYLLPWLGSGSTLRGYGTGRFRDRHSLLLSGEWRWIPNRFFLDMALFYDAGTVAHHFADLSFDKMKQDYGIGIRFHGPEVTAFRFDVAHGTEGWQFVFSAAAPF
jgi:hypothetical protein